MDASSSLGQGQPDLSKLSAADQQELQQFLVNESQKARIQHCAYLFFLQPPSIRPPTPHVGLLPRTFRGEWTDGNSGARAHGYLLDQMRDGQDCVREVGEERGELHAELCGSVYGCEYDGAEAFGEYAESGHVREECT